MLLSNDKWVDYLHLKREMIYLPSFTRPTHQHAFWMLHGEFVSAFLLIWYLSSGFIEEDSPFGKRGQKGTYSFEFSRPLRTMDRLQQVNWKFYLFEAQILMVICYHKWTESSRIWLQDVQFTIGQSSKVAVAFWYPTDGNPWSKSQHYSASCNWLTLEAASVSGPSVSRVSSSGSWDAVTVFALLLSVVSFCLTVFIGYWVSKTKAVPFTPIDHLWWGTEGVRIFHLL